MRTKTWKKKVLSFFLAVALILGSSGIVQAEEPETPQSGQEVTMQNEDESQELDNECKEENLSLEENAMSQYNMKLRRTGAGITATLRVDGYGRSVTYPTSVTLPDTYKSLAEYGLTDETDPGYYTPLHLMAQYCVDRGIDPADKTKGIDISDGFLTNFLGVKYSNDTFFMFEVNNQYQVDSSGDGYGIATYPLQANDNVVVYDWYWSTNAAYAYFSQENMSANAGEEFTVILKSNSGMGTDVAFCSEADILIQDINGNELEKGKDYVVDGKTDDSGQAKVTIFEQGTYILTAERKNEEGYHELNRPYAKVSVGQGIVLSDEEAVELAKEKLNLADTSAVGDTMTLPDTGIYGTTISWDVKADDAEYVADSTTSVWSFFRPVKNDATITLIATVKKGTASALKEIPITLKGKSAKLSQLSVDYGSLNFQSEVQNYIVYVPLKDQQGNDITKLKITAIMQEDGLKKINGSFVWQDVKEVDLNDNNRDTIITITSTVSSNAGELRSYTETTTLTIKRAANKGEPLPDLPNITWGQHLGDKNNNAVSDAKTPTGEVELQWESFSNAKDYGSVYSGTPILVNGYIYAVRNNKIEMLDAKTGKVKESSELYVNAGYYSNIIYGGGMIFVPLEDGKVQCFNAVTLKSMYIIASPATFGTMLYAYGAMHYDAGILYVGYTNFGSDGCYAAYDTIDLDVDNETELVTPLWKTENGQSYYGSGAVTIDGNVVIAGDSGVISVHNAYTGEKLSECQLDGAVRGSLVYAEGYIWTATQGKKIYKFALSDKGNLEMVKEASLPGITNASPVVTGGKVYITGGSFNDGGFFAVYDMDLRLLAKETTENLLNTPTVTTAYDDVYVYFTENGPEGSLYMAKVTANNKITLTKLYTPQHPQYCMSKVVVGADGTLYYGNDAGYLYAIHVKGQEKPIVPESPVTDDSNQNTVKLEPQKLTPTVRKLKVNASGKTKQSSSDGIVEAIVKSNEKKEKSLTVNNPPEKIESEVFETLAGYPDFRLILDCGNYTLSIKGSDITDTSAVLNTKLIELENTLSEKEASKYGNYQQLAFVQEGKLPGKVTVVYHLGKQFDKSLVLYLYDMSNPENATEVVLQDSYAMFTLESSGEFILSDSKAENAVEADLAEIEEELLPSEKEKTGIPVWAYLLIGIGVGAIFGGIITTKVVTARKKEDTWEK
ncbi:PQQ-binding-like beta-propeller repeat protein [Faecalicatena contorta]|uniref:immunoglobulin-like domain-containing protein n=1 Tax=Faecalicatena contorta TaxID=39482 RepID=UPI001F24BD21|nr:immunoglobulin-like domain-containing protein [Faecalicatena contorta]MCF2681297.1 PQQ-binding-like beta-propeller repeat protein [Faecalicatena contorta]